MMGRLLSVFYILVLLISCNGIERPEKPDNFLSENEMVDLLYDVNLLNATRSSLRSKLAEKEIHPDSFLYLKYGLDSAQLAGNIAFYSSEFSTYIRIQERVEERLNMVEDSLRRYKERLDSIERQEIVDRRKRTLELERKKRDSIAQALEAQEKDSL